MSVARTASMTLAMAPGALLAVLLTGAGLVAPATAAAAEPRVQITTAEPPHHTGVPVQIQVVAYDLTDDPEPEIRFQDPPQGLLQVVSKTPAISSFTQIINGRVTQSKTVRWVFDLSFTAARPGRYSVGPFEIAQGAQTIRTRPVTLDLEEVPKADAHEIRLLLPERKVYVGEQLPVKLEWAVEANRRNRIVRQTVEVPFFNRIGEFEFRGPDNSGQKQSMILRLQTGDREYPADVSQQRRGNQRWMVTTVEDQFVPLRSGTYELAPATVVFDEAVRFRRDLFGNQVPTHTIKLQAADEPRTLEVAPLPAAGRPASFAGAVGRGFSLEATATPTVVQVGDPIRVELALRGGGSLATAALPPLSELLPKTSFRAPEDKLAGVVRDGAKHFEATVRVTDAGVRELPAIAYSWFDPDKGAYETTYSKPIALSVGQAQVVGAADVVRGDAGPAGSGDAETGDTDAGTTANGAASPATTAAAAAGDAGRRGFTLSGAELAISTDTEALSRSHSSLLAAAWLRWLAWIGGLAALAAAVYVRRRRGVDPATARRASLADKECAAIAAAANVGELTAALRRVRAEAGAGHETLERLIEECDSRAFAPGGREAAAEPDLKTRAETACRQALGETR